MFTRKLEKFRQLQANEKIAVIEAAFVLGFVGISSLILPHNVWLRVAVGKPNKHRDSTGTANQSALVLVSSSVVSAANNMPWPSNCLRNALAGKLMLARRGIQSEIILGARPNQEHNGNAVEFHGWLNVDGHTIIGGEDLDDFRELSAL